MRSPSFRGNEYQLRVSVDARKQSEARCDADLDGWIFRTVDITGIQPPAWQENDSGAELGYSD